MFAFKNKELAEMGHSHHPMEPSFNDRLDPSSNKRLEPSFNNRLEPVSSSVFLQSNKMTIEQFSKIYWCVFVVNSLLRVLKICC